MTLYLVCNIYAFASFFLIIYGNRGGITSWWVVSVFKILFAAQGWFIPLMRLSEPYFYQILTRKISGWWNNMAKKQEVIQATND